MKNFEESGLVVEDKIGVLYPNTTQHCTLVHANINKFIPVEKLFSPTERELRCWIIITRQI